MLLRTLKCTMRSLGNAAKTRFVAVLSRQPNIPFPRQILHFSDQIDNQESIENSLRQIGRSSKQGQGFLNHSEDLPDQNELPTHLTNQNKFLFKRNFGTTFFEFLIQLPNK